MLLNDFAHYFCKVKCFSCKETTTHYYKYTLKPLQDFFNNRPLKSISIIDLDHYIISIMEHENYSICTKKDLVHTALHFFHLAYKKEVIEKDLSKFVTIPRFPSCEKKSLTEEELNHILDVFKDLPFKYQLLTHLFCETGKRRGEILGLDWQDIHFAERSITIRQNYTYVAGSKPKLTSPKTNKISSCVISNQLTQFLFLYKEHVQTIARKKHQPFPQAVFINEHTLERLHPCSLTTYYRLKKLHCNVEKLSPHLFRHTVASLLLSHGANIKEVGIQLDHNNPAFTLRQYIHYAKKPTTQNNNLILQKIIYH